MNFTSYFDVTWSTSLPWTLDYSNFYVSTIVPHEKPPRVLYNLIIGVVLTSMTFLGQILVLYIFKTTKKLHQPSNYFIVSLALADLCIR